MSEEENQNENPVGEVEETAKTAIPAEGPAEESMAKPVHKEAAPADGSPNTERRLQKTRIGVVVSDKMEKTIVVSVVRRVTHPVFKKIVKRTTKLYAHDEKREAKIGDKVLIIETRPISKRKRWRLTKVLEH